MPKRISPLVCAVAALCFSSVAVASDPTLSDGAPPDAVPRPRNRAKSNSTLLLVGGLGSTRGAHTEGLSAAFELHYASGFFQGVAFAQGSDELLGGSSDEKLGLGLGAALRFHRLQLSLTAIAGYGSYVIRDGCLLFCDDSRPTERGSSAFVGGHGTMYIVFPRESGGGGVVGLITSLVHDLSDVASQPAGAQLTMLLSGGGYFSL